MQQLDEIARDLFAFATRCAYRGPHGEWVMHLDQPHNDEKTHRQFLTELFRAMLTPPDERERNGEIAASAANTTTMPLDQPGDGGGGV